MKYEEYEQKYKEVKMGLNLLTHLKDESAAITELVAQLHPGVLGPEQAYHPHLGVRCALAKQGIGHDILAKDVHQTVRFWVARNATSAGVLETLKNDESLLVRDACWLRENGLV